MIKNVLTNKWFNILLFLLFIFSGAMVIFKEYLFLITYKTSGDEFYFESLYNIKNVTLNTITSVRSQYYIFLASIINEFVKNPILSARIVPIIHFVILYAYFLYKIKSLKTSFSKKVQYCFIVFICIMATIKIFNGVSDFISYFFLFFVIIELNKFYFENKHLSNKEIIMLSVFVALAVTNRPTSLIILFAYGLTLLFLFRSKVFFNKSILVLPFLSILFIAIINFGSIKNTGFIKLDIKDVTEDGKGITWFEANYFMVKFWELGILPKNVWVGSAQVEQYKSENPDVFVPKNYFDILVHEPVLYGKQMIKMFITANLSLFSKLGSFYLLLLYILYRKYNKSSKKSEFNDVLTADKVNIIELMLLVFYISVIIFSFLAFKLFEFRWVNIIYVILLWYSLQVLVNFNEKTQNITLNLFYACFVLWVIKSHKLYMFFI